MYNKEIKERYIELRIKQTSMKEYYFRHIFGLIEAYEEKLDKDICNFSTYEILDMYKTLNFRAFRYLVTINSQLTVYTSWCISQNMVMDCQNHFAELDKNLILKCINTTSNEISIISKEKILEWCEMLPNPSDAFVLLAIYEGIAGKNYKEIVNATIQDIDDHILHTCTGRDVEMSDRLLYYANRSYDTLEYSAITGTRSKTINLIPSENIIKEYPNVKAAVDEFQKGRRIYSKISRSFIFLGVDKFMNSNRLTVSGMIDFTNRKCEEYGLENASEFMYGEHFQELCKQYDTKIIQRYFLMQYGDYLYPNNKNNNYDLAE